MAAGLYRVCGAKSGRLIPNRSGLGNNAMVSLQPDVPPQLAAPHPPSSGSGSAVLGLTLPSRGCRSSTWGGEPGKVKRQSGTTSHGLWRLGVEGGATQSWAQTLVLPLTGWSGDLRQVM